MKYSLYLKLNVNCLQFDRMIHKNIFKIVFKAAALAFYQFETLFITLI